MKILITQCSKGEQVMKKHEAFSKINSLSGIVKIQEIVDILHSIDNFKESTLGNLGDSQSYKESEGKTVNFTDLYVDLTYQRKLKIQALINRLLEYEYFDKDVAGHVDVSIRPDGKMFVWDGFHRCIMAALAGLTKISCSIFKHPSRSSNKSCMQKEARMFKIRNADKTSMQPDEIFKSEIAFDDPDALKILDVLKEANLDVQGTNPTNSAYALGGFGFFKRHWCSGQYSRRYIIDASSILQEVFSNTKTMSVNLLFGVVALLDANGSDDKITVSNTEITKKLKEIVVAGKRNENTQNIVSLIPKDLIGKTIKHYTAASIARNLLRRGVQDLYNNDGSDVTQMIKYLEIDEDDFELLEKAA